MTIRRSFHYNGGTWDAEFVAPWGEYRRPLSAIPGALVLLAATVLLGLGSVSELAHGSLGAAALFGGFAFFFASLTGLVIHPWRPRRAKPVQASGLTFRYSITAYIWGTGICLSCLAAMFGLAWIWLPLGIGQAIAAVLVLALSIPIAIFTVAMLRLAPGQLVLTPEGLHHRCLSHTHFVAWSEVRGLEAVTSYRSRAIVVEVSRSVEGRVKAYHWPDYLSGAEYQALPNLMIRDPWLASDPALVYQTLRHYLVNPEHRVELGTEAALLRIEQRRFSLY